MQKDSSDIQEQAPHNWIEKHVVPSQAQVAVVPKHSKQSGTKADFWWKLRNFGSDRTDQIECLVIFCDIASLGNNENEPS